MGRLLLSLMGMTMSHQSKITPITDVDSTASLRQRFPEERKMFCPVLAISSSLLTLLGKLWKMTAAQYYTQKETQMLI
jgi:hypothetical protein